MRSPVQTPSSTSRTGGTASCLLAPSQLIYYTLHNNQTQPTLNQSHITIYLSINQSNLKPEPGPPPLTPGTPSNTLHVGTSTPSNTMHAHHQTHCTHTIKHTARTPSTPSITLSTHSITPLIPSITHHTAHRYRYPYHQ